VRLVWAPESGLKPGRLVVTSSPPVSFSPVSTNVINFKGSTNPRCNPCLVGGGEHVVLRPPHFGAPPGIEGARLERPRGNLSDLYPRWLGARELLLHGRDPYSPEITREIQRGYYGRELDSSRPNDPGTKAASPTRLRCVPAGADGVHELLLGEDLSFCS